MSKSVKLALAVFVGLDIFIVGYIGLSQLRLSLFGQGQIPGGGSALDMALFLLPLFLAWVAGDRLYYFLTYKQRQAARSARDEAASGANLPDRTAPRSVSQPVGASAWDERGWSDEESGPVKK